MAELTVLQRQFLDNYIRQHRVIGRIKQSESKKYLRRVGKIETAMGRLPSWEVGTEIRALAEADQRANSGDFIGAYRDLKRIKINVKRRADRYDPAATFEELENEIQQCLAAAPPAIAAVQGAYDDPQIDQPFNGDQAGVRDLLASRHPMTDLQNYLETFATTRERIRQRANEMERFDVNRARAVLPLLDDGFAHLAHLPDKNGRPRPFDAVRNEVLDECARRWSTRGGVPDQFNSDGLVDGKLDQDRNQDQQSLPGTQEHAPEHFRDIARFDMKTFLQGMPGGSPQEIGDGVTQKLTAMFTSEGTNKDILLDVQLKTEDEWFWDYLEQNKLTATINIQRKWKERLDKGAEAKAEAFAKAMMKVAREQNPNSLDFAQGSMMFDGDEFATPRILSQGAFGEVRKFVDKSDPTKSVVVKTALQNKQKNLLYEARQHQRAMEGPPTEPGRQNVLEMKGIVHDETGKVHIVLETADGGNLNDMKETMKSVGDALPEEARNLMNQFLMKQAIEGVMYLRDRGMIHVDLKEDNVFVMSDGTVKVADLGGAVSRSDNDQLRALESGDLAAGTGAYLSPESMSITQFGSGDVSTKGDTYALGKMSRLMHLGQKAPTSRDGTKVQGALSRLTEAMTSQKPGDRPTLESVLESSYFQNFEPDREADVRELTQAVLALGKKKKALASSPNDEQLGEEVAELEYRVRELSTLATRPSDDFAERPGEQIGDFLRSLQSAAVAPSSFCKYLGIPSTSRYLKSFGGNSYDIKKAVDCWAWDMADPELRKGETQVADRLERAKQAVQEALGKITNKSLRDVLAKGFAKMLAELHRQFVAAHGEGDLPGADDWTNDLVDQDAPSQGVDVEAVDDMAFKLVAKVDDVVDPNVRRDCAGVLEIPAVPCQITVECTRKSDDKKFADAPSGSEQSAAIVLDTVQQRNAAFLNQRIAALLADVRQYQTAYNNGVRTAPDMAAVLVEGAAKALGEELASSAEQLKLGIKNAGLFGFKLTGLPFHVQGTPLVALNEQAFPPPRPYAEEYQEMSLGELTASAAEERLTGRAPFTWLVREEADTFVVSSIEPDGDGTKFVHTVVDAEKVGIGVFRTYLGEPLRPEQK